MEREKSKALLADTGLFYAAAIWGSTFFIVKNALLGIDPVVMVAFRFLLAGIILLVYLLYKKKNIFAELKTALFLSVILCLLYIPQTVGLKDTTASNSGFITGLFVAFIPIFLRLIFKVKPNLMEMIASVVSLLGLWILTGGMKDINFGDSLTLLAAVTYALHVLYSDKYMKQGIDPIIISCQQFLIVGLLSLSYALIAGLPLQITTTYALNATIFLAIFPTLSAFLIQMFAQKIRPPLRVSLIFALEPVFAAIFAWTIGGEEIITHRAIGGGFIFIALIISGLPVSLLLKKKIPKT